MDVRWTLKLRCVLTANTRRCFDVDSTSFERYGRQMDVETTLRMLTGVEQIGSYPCRTDNVTIVLADCFPMSTRKMF